MFVVTASCQNLFRIKTVIKPKSTEHTTEIEALQSFMEARCKKLNYRHVSVKHNENAGTISVTTEIDPESEFALERYRSLFKSNSLELWETYRINDPEIKSILPSLPEINGFLHFRNLNPENYQIEVLGLCNDETLLESIVDSFKIKCADLPDLQLLWSLEKEQLYTGEEGYKLYLINTNGQEEAAINDTHITKAEGAVNDYDGMPQVLFDFNEEGTSIWADITRAAAHNNRSIAIVINDRVYAAPRVMSEITGGKCAISGDFTLIQADNIATAIALGRLPFPIEILEEKIFQKGDSDD